jgi:hypothetical protein
MSSTILQQFSLPPVQADKYPMVTHSGMVEVIPSEETSTIPRSSIIDLAYVLPIKDAESGFFYMAGATNMFFVRFVIRGAAIQPCQTEFFYMCHIIQPLTLCLFHSLNYLAQQLKKKCFTRQKPKCQCSIFEFSFEWMHSSICLTC